MLVIASVRMQRNIYSSDLLVTQIRHQPFLHTAADSELDRDVVVLIVEEHSVLPLQRRPYRSCQSAFKRVFLQRRPQEPHDRSPPRVPRDPKGWFHPSCPDDGYHTGGVMAPVSERILGFRMVERTGTRRMQHTAGYVALAGAGSMFTASQTTRSGTPAYMWQRTHTCARIWSRPLSSGRNAAQA